MTGFFSMLKYKLFGRKVKIETQEAANILLDQLLSFAVDDFMKEVDEIASDAEIALKNDDFDTIRGAVLITTFWICIHALEYDDQKFINALYYGFINKMGGMNVDENVLKESIDSHFIKYNTAWKEWENSPKYGLGFGYAVLCGIFNSGLPDDRFCDPLLSLRITNFVTSGITAICAYKERIDKIYEYQDIHH